MRTPSSRQLKSARKRKPTRPNEGNLHGKLEQAADQRSQCQSHKTALAELRVPPVGLRLEPTAERDAADDRAEIEKARGHRRHAKNVLRVEHPHHQRGQRDQQDERIHDPREQDRERRLFGPKPGSEDMQRGPGRPTMPSKVTALMKTAVSVATLFASRQAEASPSVAIFFEKVVTKAVESAPSAKRSRNIFGARNAVRNASIFGSAPKSEAKTTSRIKPRMRLQKWRCRRCRSRACLLADSDSRVLSRTQQNSGVPAYERKINEM